jgi:hypothetical protein
MTSKNPANKDPISGAPGAHPAGVGAGAAAGAATGAVIGSVAGPVGTVLGGAAGAVAGGLAGKAAAESVNPTAEDAYWRDNYKATPGVKPDYSWDDDYAPAYRTGYTGWERARASGETFDAYEPKMRTEWDKVKGKSRLNWEEAKDHSRAAWHRVERALPGDADKDGR